MSGTLHQQLVAGLFLWSLLSLGSSTIGLYGPQEGRSRHFWFMSGLWGLIDGAIALYALVRPPMPPAEMGPILRWNAGLDVIYLISAVVLISRKDARLRGYGLAVAVQGLFLLAFDLYFAWRCAVAGG